MRLRGGLRLSPTCSPICYGLVFPRGCLFIGIVHDKGRYHSPTPTGNPEAVRLYGNSFGVPLRCYPVCARPGLGAGPREHLQCSERIFLTEVSELLEPFANMSAHTLRLPPYGKSRSMAVTEANSLSRHQSPGLLDPFSELHHQDTAWMFSEWSSRPAPPIPFGCLWSGTMSL